MASNLRNNTTLLKENISFTRKLKFEKLITAISSRFVGNYDLDEVINKSLADMGEYINASRVFIFLFDKEKLNLVNTHEWYNKGIESHMKDYNYLHITEVPWVIKQFLKEKPIIIRDVSKLPPEAKKLKDFLMNHGILSNLTIPFYINGTIGGFIGFDDEKILRNWEKEDLNLLQISSQIIGNALERKISEDTLKESESRYRELINHMTSGIAVYDAINYGEDFIFKDFNLAGQKIDKVKKEEVIGKKVTEVFPSVKEFGIFDVFQRVWKTGEPEYYPISFYKDKRISGWRKNYIYKIPSGEIIVIYDDVTEKIQNEQKLKISEGKIIERVKELSCLYGLSKLVLDSTNSIEDIIEETLNLLLLTSQFPDITCARIIYDNNEFKTSNFRDTKWKLLTSTTTDKKRLEIEISYLQNQPFLKEEENLINEIGVRLSTIIKQKEVEQKLKESEKKYRNLVENAQEGIWVVDENDNTILVNLKISDMLGYTTDEMKGKNLTLFLEDSMFELVNSYRKHRENGLKGTYDLEFKKKDGGKLYTIVKASPILGENGEFKGSFAYISDVTDKKIAEQKLKESEEKYRSVLENINEGYFEVDLKGNFTFFNDALCESTEYSREELLYKNYNIIFDEETTKRIFTVYSDLYKRGEGTDLFDYQITTKDGRHKYHESSVYLRYSLNGDIIGFKGFIRDISERKKAEALSKKFSQELEKEVKLQTKELKVALEHQKLYLEQILKASNFKTEFLATMSHELRTPLNAIIGFVELLIEGGYGQLNSEQLDFIKIIEESSKHLLDLISNILDISKIESGQVTLKIENIEVYDIIQQVFSNLNPICTKKDLKFELKGLKKNQKILADRIKFKQIIFNLLNNAIKFTEKGIISFEFIDKKDKWEFNVKDTGVGIAKEDFSIIFKEFKRVRSSYVDSKPGSGLGLALTKRLVNLHGGNISFMSKVGNGTTFTFFVPKRLGMFRNIGNVKQFLELL